MTSLFYKPQLLFLAIIAVVTPALANSTCNMADTLAQLGDRRTPVVPATYSKGNYAYLPYAYPTEGGQLISDVEVSDFSLFKFIHPTVSVLRRSLANGHYSFSDFKRAYQANARDRISFRTLRASAVTDDALWADIHLAVRNAQKKDTVHARKQLFDDLLTFSNFSLHEEAKGSATKMATLVKLCNDCHEQYVVLPNDCAHDDYMLKDTPNALQALQRIAPNPQSLSRTTATPYRSSVTHFVNVPFQITYGMRKTKLVSSFLDDVANYIDSNGNSSISTHFEPEEWDTVLHGMSASKSLQYTGSKELLGLYQKSVFGFNFLPRSISQIDFAISKCASCH